MVLEKQTFGSIAKAFRLFLLFCCFFIFDYLCLYKYLKKLNSYLIFHLIDGKLFEL